MAAVFFCLNAKTLSKMNKKNQPNATRVQTSEQTKNYAVTYAVTFKEQIFSRGIYYYPGVDYHFTVVTGSNHPGDLADDIWSDYLLRFDCLDEEGNIEKFLDASEPKIIAVKEFCHSSKTAKIEINAVREISYQIEYKTLEDLLTSINELLEEFSIDYSDNCSITLPCGKTGKWCVTYAHYCFAEGRISETQLAEYIFAKGGVL